MPAITAHCIVRNEEYFIGYAIESVLPFVEKIIVYDTGSTDRTGEIIARLALANPGKIIFDERGPVDAAGHTQLRQAMIERTLTDWFLILDGDEIWTTRALDEAKTLINNNPELECVIAPFYLCVGDVAHYSRRGYYEIRGQKTHATPRFFRRQAGMRWEGKYNYDAIVDAAGQRIFEKPAVEIMKNRFWHVTHLPRSSQNDLILSSGGSRSAKQVPTYLFIGRRIEESLPEVFSVRATIGSQPLAFGRSFVRFFGWAGRRIVYKIKNLFSKPS